MIRSFGAALRLILRWEVWALVGMAILPRQVAWLIRQLFPGGGTSNFWGLPLVGILQLALSAGLFAASMVLLLPLSRGARGLDFRYLGRNITTTLAGAGITVGTVLPLGILVSRWARSGFFGIEWIVVDLSVLLCAWYVHGRGEEERGRRPPGPWISLKVGLVTGFLALWIPGGALRSAIEAVDPGTLQGTEYALPMLGYSIGTVIVPLFFGAWFYGSLDEEEQARPSA